jgi:aminoglycoside 6-adenylyltransferase
VTDASHQWPNKGNGELLDEIVRWATARDDVRALVMTGSRARPTGPVDAWSDYDIELFTTNTDRYASNDWMAEIRPVWVCLALLREDDPRYRMRLTVFSGGDKVDFAVAPVEMLREWVARRALPDLYERGYVILLDKDDLASRLPAPTYGAPRQPPPNKAEFQATVEEFWFEASHIPKYLFRDELWVVKFRDWTMKTLLLRMLGWYATANDPASDVWDIGGHMASWLDPTTRARLGSTFGRYEATDSWQALLSTTDLFRDLTAVTAERLGFAYPNEAEVGIGRYLRSFVDLLGSVNNRTARQALGVREATLRAQQLDFEQSSDPEVGRLLAVLAGGVRENGRILEIGTGVGYGTAWIVEGLAGRDDVELISIEMDRTRNEATRDGEWPPFVRFVLGDILELFDQIGTFSLIFADAQGGKWEGLDRTIAALATGGLLVVDDMRRPAVETVPDQAARTEAVREALLADRRLITVELDWSSGVMLARRV